MAQYYVKHSCGHGVIHHLFGKYVDREEKIKWLETVECLECKKTRELADAEEKAETLGLPELTGSEKQVAWAMTIRNEMLKKEFNGFPLLSLSLAYMALTSEERDGFWQNILPYHKDNDVSCIFRLQCENLLRAAEETSAQWFIENRDQDFSPFLMQVVTTPLKRIARHLMDFSEDKEKVKSLNVT